MRQNIRFFDWRSPQGFPLGVWLCLRREEHRGSDRERGRRATLATKTDRGHEGASA